MTEEGFPIGPKKRGRPKKARPQLPNVTDGNAGETKVVKPRPACEKDELAKYPDPKIVVWGVQPECKRFKRKGLAILYNPAHKGGQVTLMPVTDDGEDGMRWRYRGVPGPCPFRYEKIDLEPGQAATLPTKLRELADTIEGVVVEHFGDAKGADKTSEVFLSEKRGDKLGDLIRSKNVF